MKLIKEQTKDKQLTQLLNKIKQPSCQKTAHEAMEELNNIMKRPIEYEYKIENGGVILNRDALDLGDRVGASVYQTYLDQEVPKSDKFFVAYITYDENSETGWTKCFFRRLEMGDVQLQALLQRMSLELTEGFKIALVYYLPD